MKSRHFMGSFTIKQYYYISFFTNAPCLLCKFQLPSGITYFHLEELPLVFLVQGRGCLKQILLLFIYLGMSLFHLPFLRALLDIRFLVDGLFLWSLWTDEPTFFWSPLFLMRVSCLSSCGSLVRDTLFFPHCFQNFLLVFGFQHFGSSLCFWMCRLSFFDKPGRFQSSFLWVFFLFLSLSPLLC